jgi:hypothetical protein
MYSRLAAVCPYSAQRTKYLGLTYSSHYPPLPSASSDRTAFVSLRSAASRTVQPYRRPAKPAAIPQSLRSAPTVRCAVAALWSSCDRRLPLAMYSRLGRCPYWRPQPRTNTLASCTVATINRYRQLHPTAQLSCHCTLISITVQPYPDLREPAA